MAFVVAIDERAYRRAVLEFWRIPLNRAEILASIDREIARLEHARKLLAQNEGKTGKSQTSKSEKKGSGRKSATKRSSASPKRLQPERTVKRSSSNRLNRSSGRYEIGRSRGSGKLGGDGRRRLR